MDKFAQFLTATSAFFSEYVSRIAKDGVSLREIDEIDEYIDKLKQALQGEREIIEAALEDAGGRDVQGDLNRAQKCSAHLDKCNCQECQQANKFVEDLGV